MPEMTDERMGGIFLDLSLADQILQRYPPAERDSIKVVLTESLLKIHDLERPELDTLLYFYMTDFERFEKSLKSMEAKNKELLSNIEK